MPLCEKVWHAARNMPLCIGRLWSLLTRSGYELRSVDRMGNSICDGFSVVPVPGYKIMSRVSGDIRDTAGNVTHGFDYDLQVWVEEGIVLRCGHPEHMDCGCNGRAWAGWELTMIKPVLMVQS